MNHYFDPEHLDESALDDLIEGFQFISFDWRYLYANNAVVRQSKYQSKEELPGFTMTEKYPCIEHTELFGELRECMNDRVSKYPENKFVFADCFVGWFELRIHPVSRGLFILSIDITQRKRSEEQRKNLIKDPEEMIFMTTHRLRQPISNILGASDLLDLSKHESDEINVIMSHMKKAAQSLDEFTRELTDFIHDKRLTAHEFDEHAFSLKNQIGKSPKDN